MVPLEVTPDLVASVVSDWTGIPVGKMVQDQAGALLELEQTIGERIRGQDHALDVIAEVIRAAKMGLGNPDAPIGVFLLVGPSRRRQDRDRTRPGRHALRRRALYGHHQHVGVQEKHTVSRLIGSPPGYVGYGEGGRADRGGAPAALLGGVLLDEVEKADPEVMNLFYQVFDKGKLSDGEGRVIDFKNTVLLMTSNLASEMMTDVLLGDTAARPARWWRPSGPSSASTSSPPCWRG